MQEASYEGIEAAKVIISGGTINIVSTDDGINAADGTENIPERSNANGYIIIEGGNITVDASGDGIDSNGTVLIKGGYITIHGPVARGDASLDSDGGILIEGGTLIAAGSLGMVETPAKNSTQNILSLAFSQTLQVGSKVEVVDENNEVILEFTATKSFQSVIMSSSLLKTNQTYKVLLNGTTQTTFTITSVITTTQSKPTKR